MEKKRFNKFIEEMGEKILWTKFNDIVNDTESGLGHIGTYEHRKEREYKEYGEAGLTNELLRDVRELLTEQLAAQFLILELLATKKITPIKNTPAQNITIKE